MNYEALKEKYRTNKSHKAKRLALCAEIVGAVEVVDLLRHTQQMRTSGNFDENASKALGGIETRLHAIRDAMEAALEAKYPHPSNPEFSERSLALRLEAGITQTELAHLLDISLETAGRRERGEAKRVSPVDKAATLMLLQNLIRCPEAAQEIRKNLRKELA